MSIDQKILLISLAKYVISGQSDSDTVTNLLLDLYRLVRIWFQINHVFQKSMQILFRQGATDYKVHG